MKPSRAIEGSVRERLLEAADRLFYEEGVRGVGIDRVLAEAGAAKASLYQHFGSKDELIAAYLQRRTESARAEIEAFVARFPREERAVRLFDYVVEWTESEGFRGCPVQHVVGELSEPTHPARLVAAGQREWLVSRLTQWATDAGARDSAAMAGALMVLFDGAVAAAEQDGAQRARDARWAAGVLLANGTSRGGEAGNR